MITIPIDEKDKKKKEQQQTTPTTPAPTEQTTQTETTTEQPQQPQGPIPWEITTEEKRVNPDVYNLYVKNYEPREKEIQGIETDYLDKMNKMYGLINQNSEKTKEALKKQPIADAFNMLGTAVGKLSEVASNATFSGRVAPKKVDSSDIAKQGNALLKKSYELPQYLQAIDNDIIQNKAKQLQNEYAVNMNRLQRQMQYIQNAIEQSTDKTKIKYLSQEALALEKEKIDLKRKHNERMEELKEKEIGVRKLGIYANANKGNGNDKFDKLTINGVDYPAPDGTVYEIATKSDLFPDEELERIQGLEPSVIRGEIQKKFDEGIFPKYYRVDKKTSSPIKKTPFPLMTTLRALAKTQRNN